MQELATAPQVIYTKNQAIDYATEWFGSDDMAADSWVRKYALKKSEDEYLESTPDDMFTRMAGALVEVEKPEERRKWFEVFREQLSGFRRIVMQGSPMMGLGNKYFKSTLSNCYVVPIKEDSLEGIFQAGAQCARIQALRGGVGVDISPLRPDGASVDNAAITSTGGWSWADFFSYITRKIGQNGRRGALMVTIDVNHPDVEKFISMKSDLGLVTGANVSVKLTDDFMRAVEEDRDHVLEFIFKDADYPPIRRTIRARKLWNQIITNATKFAEPGILMWDTIIRRSPADSYADLGFKTICTNPCSEIPLSAYDSCRLTSLNLTGFVDNPYTPEAEFNYGRFEESVRCGVRMLDNMVDLDIPLQPFEEQREVARNGRRLGLGTHGLADTIASLNLKYDTDEAIKFVDGLYHSLKVFAYTASIDLAEERGPFPIFDWQREKDNEYILDLPVDLQERMARVGRRNIAILTCAPTGTVSVLSQTSSGIEPIFQLVYDRRVKIFGSDKHLATEIDNDGEHWRTFRIWHHAFARARPDLVEKYSSLPLSEVNDKLKSNNSVWVTADKIDWRKRVEMQAAITRHLDHASSSTINLPKGTKPELVGEIYMYAWKMGLKGVTVYVDGSRDGVLLTGKNTKRDSTLVERPNEIDARCHVVTNGKKYTIFVGLIDEKPYEIFCVPHTMAGVSDGLQGRIVKVKSKEYNFESGPLSVRKINTNEDDEMSAFTRLVSTAMRNGVPLEEINEQLDKSRCHITGLFRAINRVLAKYVGRVEGRKCPNILEDGTPCESRNTVSEEGCLKCMDCGFNKCS